MKRALTFIVATVTLLISLTTFTMADNYDISITINDKNIEFTSDSGLPFVDENGRTLVPLRVVMEEYGCEVLWDQENNSAIISKGKTDVIVPIGKPYIIVDGKNVAMDTSAVIVENRTYLPIRAVLEAFGAEVEWDNGKIIVTSNDKSSFENIYVDANGDIIFELANGETITLGNTTEKNNAVSVTNAEINASGNLIITLSDGKNINAGNVVSNGQNGKDGKDGVSVIDASITYYGDLLIRLSNGETINAGNVSSAGEQNGQITHNGKDGVSVTDAYVDRNGDLIIVLSNSKSINAGNVKSSGSSVSQLTFADYPVGTKFYLTMPTGQFDVPVKVDGMSYTVHVENIYYELSGKYDADDEEAWVIEDESTTFAPYVLTFHAECSADANLADAVIDIRIGYGESTITISGKADSNATLIAEKTYNTMPTPPSDVCFYKITIAPAADYSACVGNWYSIGDSGIVPTNLRLVLTVADDGSFVYNETTYYPTIYDSLDGIIAFTDDYIFEFNKTFSVYDLDYKLIQILYPETKDISHLTGKYHNDNGTIIVNADGSIVYDGITYPIAVVEYDVLMEYGYYAQIQVGSENLLLRFNDNRLRVIGETETKTYYKEISDLSEFVIVGDWYAFDVNGDGILPAVNKITVNSDGTIVYGDTTYDATYTYYIDENSIVANIGILSMRLIFDSYDGILQIDGEIDYYAKEA